MATTADRPRQASKLRELWNRVDRPVPTDAVAFFRIGFGAIVAWEAWRYLDHDWVRGHYVEPSVFFGYWPFEWVRPLPEPWIQLVFIAMGVAGAAMALGAFYRVAAPVASAALIYIFLLDKTWYLNHWYLMILLSVLLVFIPAHRKWSIDARRNPALRRASIPGRHLFLLRFQMAVPYVFGGIAKLNPDWLRGSPLDEWLFDETDFPLIGGFMDDRGFVLLLAYAALALDLLAPVGLMSKRTRPVAFAAITTFHLMNSRLFSIGVFPWAMIVGSTIFLPADWPSRAWRSIRTDGPSQLAAATGAWIGALVGSHLPGRFMLLPTLIATGAGALVGLMVVGRGEVGRPAGRDPDRPGLDRATSMPRASRLVVASVAVWVLIQVLVPLRHLAIPGDVHWTEEGHRFAWHMKLRDKDAEAVFYAEAPSGLRWELDPEAWLTSTQARKMAARPDMIVQFAEVLEDEFDAIGYPDVAITVDATASLNHGPPGPLIDPTVDLTTVSYPWWPPAPWIMPRPRSSD